MEKVGFRFHPTDHELINFYLTNQILGYTQRVVQTMSEINFYEYDPIYLPSLSRNQSDNGIYYFFALKQYTNSSRRFRKRSSEYGLWKLTGEVTDIKDKSGEKIGDKHVLVHQKRGAPKAKGMKSSWVMHEYQITHSQYHNLNLDTYVICKLFDKREETHVSYGNNSSESTHHPQISAITTFPEFDEQPGPEIDDLIIPMNIDQEDLSKWDYSYNNIPNVQLQTHYLSQENDEFLGGLKHVKQGQIEPLYYNQESYRQKNSVRGMSTLPELEQPYGMPVNDFTMPIQEDYGFDPNMQLQTPYSSHGYAESISAMSHQSTWSSVDSVSSSNIHFTSCSSTDSCTDIQTFADLFTQ